MGEPILGRDMIVTLNALSWENRITIRDILDGIRDNPEAEGIFIFESPEGLTVYQNTSNLSGELVVDPICWMVK